MGRLGARMLMVLIHVRDHPGCTKHAAAATHPVGIRAGYHAVDRCINAGWISATPVPGSRSYALHLTASGGQRVEEGGDTPEMSR
jgi:hypothetical protein